MRHEKHIVDHKFHVGDHVWLHISKERLQGPSKKLKPITYGPFEIMEKVSENAFRLNLPEYMNNYSFINVEHLKLYKPSMLTKYEAYSDQNFPYLDELSPNTMDKVKEYFILQKKICAIRRGEIELWLVGFKRQKPDKAKWMDKSRIRELYPHLCIYETKYLLLKEM